MAAPMYRKMCMNYSRSFGNPLFRSVVKTFLRKTKRHKTAHRFADITKFIPEKRQWFQNEGLLNAMPTLLFGGMFGWLENKPKKAHIPTDEELLGMLGPLNAIGFHLFEGNSLLADKKLEEADKKLDKALKLASKLHKDNMVDDSDFFKTQVMVYSTKSDIAILRSQFEAAEKLLQESIKISLSMGMDLNSNQILESSIQLAYIFSQRGKIKEARVLLESCIRNQNLKLSRVNNPPQNDPSRFVVTESILGLALERYGVLLNGQNENEAAKAVFMKSDEIAGRYLGGDDVEGLVKENNILGVYLKQWHNRNVENEEKGSGVK